MRIVALIASFLFLVGCTGSRPSGSHRGEDYRVIAYVFGDPGIERIGAEKLTHINYAFGLVGSDGRIYVPEDRAPHLGKLVELRKRNPDLKILLSVGGWGADGFSDAALTDSTRRIFAESALALVRRFDLDGIDVDWEYPGNPGPGIKYRPEDRENFTLMLRSLRDALGSRYLLTIASAGGDYFRRTEMDRLHRYLDWINVMTYDFYGSYTPVTGHHTGLFGRSAEDRSNTDAYVRQHLAAGIPPGKIVIGAAFYGKAWAGVDSTGGVVGRPYTRYANEFSYARIVDSLSIGGAYTRRWDPVARAPYLWNADSTTFISYDDPQSIEEKARYVKENGLGGIMYWQHGHDMKERLLDVLYENLR